MKLSTVIYFAYLFCSMQFLTGTCTVCGRPSLFFLTDQPDKIRNHARCLWCKSTCRHRHVAKCILDEFKAHARDLRSFARQSSISILNTSHGSPIAKALADSSRVLNTEFFDGCPSGEFRHGVMCQDLTALSLDSSCIDLIITEDVLEHVFYIQKALEEIHRVLKPGAVHIFSVPFSFDRATETLFGEQDGRLLPLRLPIEYHYDSTGWVIPAYYRFGYDFIDQLQMAGFSVSIRISQYEEYSKYVTHNSFTFITRKH